MLSLQDEIKYLKKIKSEERNEILISEIELACRDVESETSWDGVYQVKLFNADAIKRFARYPEAIEQEIVAAYLDAKNYQWFHVPNGGNVGMIQAMNLRRLGLKAGVFDIFIMSLILSFPHARGLFLEMKKKKGGYLSKEQKIFSIQADKNGYLTKVAHGSEKAIRFLKSIGL